MDSNWYVSSRYWRAQSFYQDEIKLDELMRQIDCYIAGDNPRELSIIEYAWKSRIEIVSFQREGLNVFKNFPQDPNAEIVKSKLKQIVDEQLLQRFPLEEYEYILPHSGLGETTLLFFLLRELKHQRKKKILLICFEKSRFDLMQRCPFADQVVLVTPQIHLFLTTFYPVKELCKMHLSRRAVQIRNSRLPFQNSESIMFQLAKEYFEIDPLTQFSRYSVQIPSESLSLARKVFESVKLREGKTIYINMRGAHYSGLDHHRGFFIKLVERAHGLGFDLVTNSQNPELPNVPNVFLNFWENVAFVGMCGNVVSVPTGWVESSCAMNEIALIKLHVIFPSLHDQFHKPSQDFFEELQLHGDRFLENTMQNYGSFVKNILPSNVDLNLHAFQESDEDSRKLIEEIVGN